MNNQHLYIIYDVTRLLTRLKAATPSGIDRIDLNYLLFFLASENYNILSIYQHGGAVYIIPEEVLRKLKNYLILRWLDIIPDEKSKSITSNDKMMKYYLIAYKTLLSTGFSKKKQEIAQWLSAHKMHNVFYFNVSHHGFDNETFFQLLKETANVKLFFCLSDLIPIEHPEFYPDNTDIKHIGRVKLMVKYADTILVISAYTQHMLHLFCKQHMLPCPKTQVLHIGVEDVFINHPKYLTSEVKNKYQLDHRDYFIIIGTIEPRKNHLLLLNLWRNMVKNDADHCPILLVIGKRGWCNQHITNMLDRCESLQNVVIELSSINDNEMVSLLKGARALLAPSFVEGWGMPVAEAATVGTPIIASDIDAFKESGQELIKYLHPIDSIAWESYIQKYSTSSSEDYRSAAVAQLNSYSPPTWHDHFNRVKNMINNSL